MHILENIFNWNNIPSTWDTIPQAYYIKHKYYTVDLDENSNEYEELNHLFPSYVIRYIQRIQNPFQLALFNIMKAMKKDKYGFCYTTHGYHLINHTNVGVALQYSLDYRRYANETKSINKHPIFCRTVEKALNIARHTKGKKAIILCDVICDCDENFETESQGDYLPKYVVAID